MKKLPLTLVAVLFLQFSCDTISKLPSMNSGVTDAEAAQGIREALSQGTVKGINFLNKTGGDPVTKTSAYCKKTAISLS